MPLEITKITVDLDNNTSVQVGQALKAGSLKQIQIEIKNNLQFLLDSGNFNYIINELQNLQITQVDRERHQYHARSGMSQFAGLNQKINHYQINRKADEISQKLFKFQHLINNLRSAVLGLPNIDFSLGIKNANGEFYYITKDMGVDTENILLNASIRDEKNARIFGNQLTTQGAGATKNAIQQAIKVLQNDRYFQNLSMHFSDMMNTIPKISDPQSTPELSWASEVFEGHIQETGEKNKELIKNYNWSHGWEPVDKTFWDPYHATRPGYDKNGHYLGFASATQGGDKYQTQVKSFGRAKNYYQFTNVNVININNMEDIFSFWKNISERIQKNGKISQKTINEILSVLLPNEKIMQLGYHTLGNIRGLQW